MDSLTSSSKITRIIDQVKKILKDKRSYVYGFIAIVLFIAGYIIYEQKMKKKKYINNKEYKTTDSNEATLYFFQTEWCPYCKKAKPIWDSLINDIGTKKINDVKLNFSTIDCDANPDLAEQYKVDSYPTIILQNKENKITYDAKIDITTLRKFLKSSL